MDYSRKIEEDEERKEERGAKRRGDGVKAVLGIELYKGIGTPKLGVKRKTS